MPKRIVVQGVQIMRDNTIVSPPIGKPFDFTAEELDQINKVNKQAVRKPKDESDDGESDDGESDTSKTGDEANKDPVLNGGDGGTPPARVAKGGAGVGAGASVDGGSPSTAAAGRAGSGNTGGNTGNTGGNTGGANSL